jgi:hypothetical protein
MIEGLDKPQRVLVRGRKRLASERKGVESVPLLVCIRLQFEVAGNRLATLQSSRIGWSTTLSDDCLYASVAGNG